MSAARIGRDAAITAGNLSELQLTLGEVAEAIALAEQSVEYADRSGDAFQRMASRTTLADARHQAGERARAEALFQEAERLQAERQPEYPRLYSLQGYRYCDLLLDLGRHAEVRDRAAQTLRDGATAAVVRCSTSPSTTSRSAGPSFWPTRPTEAAISPRLRST